MTDLSTEYLGLKLSSPLVPSSSPLTRDLDSAKRLEDAGASALVLPSLFEQVIDSQLDRYLDQIRQFKAALDIPVIASLNGISHGRWIETGRDMQEAGADAIELNVYYIPADPEMTGYQVESRYFQLLNDLRRQVTLPIVMKLTPQFSSVANMVLKLQEVGADGVSLFNRFYQPDINLDTLEINPGLDLSDPMEALLRIHWIGLLRERINISIAATGGIHDVETIIKALLAGADVTHLCSALLTHGHSYLTTLQDLLIDWMDEHEYESIEQIKGNVSQDCDIDQAAVEHSNFLDVIRNFEA